MDANQQLVGYVRAALEHGRSEGDIRADLERIGWERSAIVAAFAIVNPPDLELPLPPSPQPASAPLVSEEAPLSNDHITTLQESQRALHEAAWTSTDSTIAVDTTDQHKRVVNIIVTVGAIFLGIGVYYFLALHWLELAIALRLAIIIFSILAAYGSGWYLREVSGLNNIGTGLIFLGTLMYGAGIFLVARMFEIRDYVPEGWALWAFGSGLVALATGIFELHYVTGLLAIIAGFFVLNFTQEAVMKDPANLITVAVVLILLLLTNFIALKLRRGLSAYEQM